MTWWWFFMYFVVANKTTMHAAPFFKGSNDLCTRFPSRAKEIVPRVLGNNLWGGGWYYLSPWSCPEALFCECVTLTSLENSLLHLLSLPSWHGCYQADHPSTAAVDGSLLWSPSWLRACWVGWRAPQSSWLRLGLLCLAEVHGSMVLL